MHFNIYKYEHDLHIAKRREWEAACDRLFFSLRSLLYTYVYVCANILSCNKKENDIAKKKKENQELNISYLEAER